ncbi:MAG TPA: ribokinase [Robiginitalea sp.]|nr:ribokinase [Robiginitalea sp.]
MNRVAVIGSSNTDMVVKTSRFPAPGETVLGGEFFVFPGGKGANQAVAAARMGADVRFFCVLGDDTFGQQAQMGYAREGIRTDAIRKEAGIASGIALITVNEAGENEIVVAPGANAKLTADYLSGQAARLKATDIALAQLEIPMPAIGFLAGFYREQGIPLILNPAPARPLSPEVLRGLFGITPNQTEAEILTGIRPQTPESAEKAAGALLDQGVEHVAITLGAKGVFYLGPEGRFLLAPPQVNAIDTTAAGDVFNGVLAAGLASGLRWKDSLERANRAAALSVTRMGAQASAPYLKELQP